MPRHFYDVRVFTRGGEGGNPLGVVPDAVELSDEVMQKGATEIGYSETVYLDWTRDDPCPKLRIFTPTQELAFAGHPLIGTVWLLEKLGPMKGIDEVEVEVGRLRVGADEVSSWLEAPRPEVKPLAESPDPVFAAIGVTGPVATAGVGKPYLFLEAPSAAHVVELKPDFEALARFPLEVAVFALDPTEDGVVKMRFFAPRVGVNEDPATGSAAVGVASLLSSDGRLADGVTAVIHQGDELGVPCRIEVSVTGDVVRLSGASSLAGLGSVSI